MIEIVAQGLGDLLKHVVFVGGATAGLYIDDPVVPEVRPTDDVDCMIEISTRLDYFHLEEHLRKNRFTHASSSGDPICRWKYLGITVDIMPTDEAILGFSNKWYKSGHIHREAIPLPSGQIIQVLPAPFFLATKMEAFLGRGQDDLRTSTDFEDIVAVLDGRTIVEKEIQNAPIDLKKYLSLQFEQLLKRRNNLEEAISGHLPYGTLGANRIENIFEILKKISPPG